MRVQHRAKVGAALGWALRHGFGKTASPRRTGQTAQQPAKATGTTAAARQTAQQSTQTAALRAATAARETTEQSAQTTRGGTTGTAKLF
jgi:hypothetical protein